MEKTHYVFILPDETESYAELINTSNIQYDISNYANNLVRKAGITKKRKEEKVVLVDVYRQYISQGKLCRTKVMTCKVTPHNERMTEEEFTAEMKQVTGQLPKAFAEFVDGLSYDLGHYAGYEEIISYANTITDSLIEAIKKHGKTKL